MLSYYFGQVTVPVSLHMLFYFISILKSKTPEVGTLTTSIFQMKSTDRVSNFSLVIESKVLNPSGSIHSIFLKLNVLYLSKLSDWDCFLIKLKY